MDETEQSSQREVNLEQQVGELEQQLEAIKKVKDTEDRHFDPLRSWVLLVQVLLYGLVGGTSGIGSNILLKGIWDEAKNSPSTAEGLAFILSGLIGAGVSAAICPRIIGAQRFQRILDGVQALEDRVKWGGMPKHDDEEVVDHGD